MIAFNSPEDRDVFLSTITQSKRLAIFGPAKLQEQETRKLALKALKLPIGLEYLETAITDDEKKKYL
ncbi:hypothetical protein RO3G_06802 [Rhizopus delemar RA 99-880]|uniref:Uncharacterized protein n=1 Tax=Rhizopus delemar (strain RA 99-880 / ATCC MYA-4621 / FGSC 9543 / NRRL 43880) TaxID=246409 RepID=I1C0W7_RHIO9|nr:hypothetical protein RO3G_06802 [Rhizopus delemar RA 99-880]|eukprot:EIE82097.1 hypothetical protein RO3G_06802 [Rhizopus delemar RA 99-880]